MKNMIFGVIVVLGALPAMAEAPAQTIKVEITETGFAPSVIDVKSGTNVILEVTRKTEETCSKDIQIPSKKISKTELPLGKPVVIALGKLNRGEIKFGCGMNMMDSGRINVR